jgi:L-fucose mutarotase
MLMETVAGDPTPTIWGKYYAIAQKHDDNMRASNIERFAFYERAKKAYAVIATSEGAIYANIILKKGVIK